MPQSRATDHARPPLRRNPRLLSLPIRLKSSISLKPVRRSPRLHQRAGSPSSVLNTYHEPFGHDPPYLQPPSDSIGLHNPFAHPYTEPQAQRPQHVPPRRVNTPSPPPIPARRPSILFRHAEPSRRVSKLDQHAEPARRTNKKMDSFIYIGNVISHH